MPESSPELTKDSAREAIENYYKSHLSAGVKTEVSVQAINEREDGGKDVKASVAFLEKTSGGRETIKLVIPWHDHAYDWTASIIDPQESHTVSPDQKSSPSQDLSLPANNQKPKAGGTFDQPGNYIQEPEKVGSSMPRKGESQARKQLGYDADGWPTSGQLEAEETDLRENGPGELEEDSWLNQSDASGAVDDFDEMPAAPQEAVRLDESKQTEDKRLEEEPEPADTEEDEMKPAKESNEEQTKIVLMEYHGAADAGDSRIVEFGLFFTDEDTRRLGREVLENLDLVEDIEADEGTGLTVSVLGTEESDPAGLVRDMIGEISEAQVVWEEGHEDKYNEAMGGDNKGFYHKGVQTDANEPGQPTPDKGAQSVGADQGADTGAHKGLGHQGGTGTGSTKNVKKTKLKGSKSEALKEQGFLGDLVDMTDEEEPEAEIDAEPGEEPVEGELDDVLQELVSAQAENGLDVVMRVAQAHCEDAGMPWDEAMEQAVKDAYAGQISDQGEEPEGDLDLDVDIEEPEGAEPPEFESQEDGEAEEELTEEEVCQLRDEYVAELEEAGDEETANLFRKATAGELLALDAGLQEEQDSWADKLQKARITAWCKQNNVDEEMVEWLTDLDWVDGLEEDELAEVEAIVFTEEELEEKEPPLGSGERFAKLKGKLGARKKDKVRDPGALAAWIGQKKHGKGKMAKMAAKGRKAASLSKKYDLQLTEEDIAAVDSTGASLKEDKIKAAVEAGIDKKKITEAIRKTLTEAGENDDYDGPMAQWQRVQGKLRASSPYGRVKPETKFKGKVRVIWDDGEETWESQSDLKTVSNPRKLKKPSGGATKPPAASLSSKGGEEFKMLKSLEGLKRLGKASERLTKIVEMKIKHPKLPDDKIVEVLTHGSDEFDNSDVVKSLTESEKPKAKTEKPDEETPEPQETHIISEDIGEKPEISTLEE